MDDERALLVEDAWRDPRKFSARCRQLGFRVMRETDLFKCMRASMTRAGEPPRR